MVLLSSVKKIWKNTCKILKIVSFPTIEDLEKNLDCSCSLIMAQVSLSSFLMVWFYAVNLKISGTIFVKNVAMSLLKLQLFYLVNFGRLLVTGQITKIICILLKLMTKIMPLNQWIVQVACLFMQIVFILIVIFH